MTDNEDRFRQFMKNSLDRDGNSEDQIYNLLLDAFNILLLWEAYPIRPYDEQSEVEIKILKETTRSFLRIKI